MALKKHQGWVMQRIFQAMMPCEPSLLEVLPKGQDVTRRSARRRSARRRTASSWSLHSHC